MNPQCRRCPTSFDTRELLQEHAEYLHGDYMQARTREEYLKFRTDRGDDLTWANQLPITSFMSVSKLKNFLRAGKAISDLYKVRAKGEKKYRKQKVDCLGCGKPVDAKYGRKYHEQCRPSVYKQKRPVKFVNPRPKGSAPIGGKRRRQCIRDGCVVLFFPKSNRQKYHTSACADKARKSRAVP